MAPSVFFKAAAAATAWSVLAQSLSLPAPGQQQWLSQGLRFDCTGCGDCCRVSGDVWMTGDEAQAMARCLGMEEHTFDAIHTDVALEPGGWRRLTQRPNACIFLTEQGGCSVYEARPLQCSTYPFWPRILRNRQNWDAEREACEGINAGDEVLPPEHIADQSQRWAAWIRRFPGDSAAAVDDTQRWAKHFVSHLGLCPWAQGSLESGAVRYVCTGTEDPSELAELVRSTAVPLLLSQHPANAAITFVVAPNLLREDFAGFVEFSNWLDEEYLADEAVPPESGQEGPLGDHIAVAGFHPDWEYGSGDDENDQGSAVDWEKRAPHPTISLIKAAGILGAEHTTQSIADHNEKVLEEFGSKAAAALFAKSVMMDDQGDGGSSGEQGASEEENTFW